MPWYKIYAGLGGSFGGTSYCGTYEYNSIDEALDDAYHMAEEEYQSYEGCHGIMSPADIEEDLHDSGFVTEDMTEDEIADMIDNYYHEEIESWISYEVREATGPDDIDEE